VNNCANVEIAQRKNNEESQIFTVRHLANGFYAIINKKSGLYLDVYNAENRPGVNVQQHTGNDSDAQKWVFKEVDSHIYQIISKCNYLFLDLENGDTTDGTNVRMWTENDTNALRWKFIPANDVLPTSPSTPTTTEPTVIDSDDTIWADNLEIYVDNEVMEKGTKQKVNTIITPSNATNTDIEWESYNTAIATVSDDGVIYAKSAGNVAIWATIAIDDETFISQGIGITVVDSEKTTISLVKYSSNIYLKGTTTIKPTVKNGKGVTTYKSNNTRVAKVDSRGKVTALKAGTAKITVTNNNVSKVFTVRVLNPKLNKTSVSISRGKSYTLKITGKIGTAKFYTSNKNIATVNSKGKITVNKKAKRGSTATITVKTNGITLKCKVKVK
ncbi:MAG: Ig-like domain-containing protein, partial [Ruminococcus sp.]